MKTTLYIDSRFPLSEEMAKLAEEKGVAIEYVDPEDFRSGVITSELAGDALVGFTEIAAGMHDMVSQETYQKPIPSWKEQFELARRLIDDAEDECINIEIKCTRKVNVNEINTRRAVIEVEYYETDKHWKPVVEEFNDFDLEKEMEKSFNHRFVEAQERAIKKMQTTQQPTNKGE
jgi:hypothetical protein